MSTPSSSAGRSRFRLPAGAGLPLGVFAVAFVLWAAWLFALPVLYDTDSYYHLAAARAYAAPGSLDALPWARFSLMAEGFGDKEVLFHALLMPFATMADAGVGGRLALAFLNALLAALIAALARPALGRWAALVPFALPLLAPDLLWRLVRLRPELLSLALLLLVLAAVGKGRYRWLAPLAAAYTLAYTAFHALLGLCGLLFLWRGGVRGRWEPALVLYPLAGAGVALALHPQFPHNLTIWWVQNVEFFRLKSGLDVGREISAAPADEVFLHLLGWGLALAALVAAARRGADEAPAGEAQSLADAFTLAAVIFGALYLLMQRFVVYAVPLTTLAVLFQLVARGWRPGPWCRLPGGHRAPLALVIPLAVLMALPTLASLGQALLAGRGTMSVRARELAWAEFGRAIPPGALVAAPWGSAQVYMLYAPQALYLNVLDPVFMALPFPHEHAVARALFAGEEPDPAFATKAVLASDYLAFPSDVTHPRLQRQLMFDPRIAVVFTGYDLLYRVKSGANDAFRLDWQVQPGEAADAPWRPYPRAPTAEARAVEGYIDATRLGLTGGGCLRFRQVLEEAEATEVEWEFAPAGPSAVALDGHRLTAVQGDLGAILGGGVRATAQLTPGRHTLEVLTCPANEVAGRQGFYLVERSRRAV